ncbi:MAG: MBOAT family protein [Deltaproteobacteria bacterium]|jgi:alginate O-acetyltransferase complex protein AlgI|nr:MBOAT family protein [Deltaproteobacteria bacterium]
MLFNSQIFLLVFLPVTLIGYYLTAARDSWRLGWLLLASLVFYGYWDIRFLPLLSFSVVMNWSLARLYGVAGHSAVPLVGVAANLLMIGVFKYANFFAGSLFLVAGGGFNPWDIVLPLGISFFTFQQISYLLDLRRGRAPVYPFGQYALYVTFFPQLIAGPIVRHNELIGQFELAPLRERYAERLSRGAVLFLIGLVKKVVLADKLAEIATPLFALIADGKSLTLAEAWVAAGGYTLQLYFDFSGYSDMAIGLGLLFGLTIPTNFNAPYVALSIRDFWRRWHITLSRFLRDYLYIPLGGNRFGLPRQIYALMVTMILGGLWHGAGWTFVVWGMWHGFGLVGNHLWKMTGFKLPRAVAWLMTMLFIILGWVVFRSETLPHAWTMLATMTGWHGWSLVVNDVPHRWTVLLFALPALFGPTSQNLALEKLVPRPIYAVLAAGCFFYLALVIGDEGYSEFVYFQF